MNTYTNPWAKQNEPPTFSTNAKPVQVGKYTRYQRIPGSYDFVFEGVCFAQRAGAATEAEIDADRFAQENLLRFCGVKFGPTWADEESARCLECGKEVEPYTLACDECVPVRA